MVTDIRVWARICTDCALKIWFCSALIIFQPYHSQTSPVTSVPPLHSSESSRSRLFRSSVDSGCEACLFNCLWNKTRRQIVHWADGWLGSHVSAGLWEKRDVDQGRNVPRLWRKPPPRFHWAVFPVVAGCLSSGNSPSPELINLFLASHSPDPRVNPPMLILKALFALLPCTHLWMLRRAHIRRARHLPHTFDEVLYLWSGWTCSRHN